MNYPRYKASDGTEWTNMDESIDEPWFVAVREWAEEHSPLGWVRFDRDADTVPNLPVFDW